MNISDRLSKAREAANAGRHAEALREYIWYHNNALKHEPAQYGVRLSFALGYWIDLAEVYPPARRKLIAIRDRKTRLLIAGKGTRGLFHDVESINRALGEVHATYLLMKQLESNAPALTKQCGDLAIDAIVLANDFEMARRYWPAPESGLLQFSENFNADVIRHRRLPPTKAPRLEAFTRIYCDRVRTTMRIAEGLGFQETSDLTREWAVALVNDRRVRLKISKLLFE